MTQNLEAKVTLKNITSLEETLETLALLKILTMGNQNVTARKVKPAADVIARLRANKKINLTSHK